MSRNLKKEVAKKEKELEDLKSELAHEKELEDLKSKLAHEKEEDKQQLHTIKFLGELIKKIKNKEIFISMSVSCDFDSYRTDDDSLKIINKGSTITIETCERRD